MIPLFQPFIAKDAPNRVRETLLSGYIGEGPRVQEFENALIPWIGENAVVNSGTSALWLAYDLAGVGLDSYVITTPITCLATNAPLAHLGACILWADCDPKTGLIDPRSVWRLLLKHKAEAIVAVDYGGQVAVGLELAKLAENYGASLIEDCAHSFGAYRQHFADCECYSFQAIKHLTTGDGGALRCKNPDWLKLARLKRWFGLDRSKGGFRCEQVVDYPGYKFHMNDIAASIGLANLPYMEANITVARRHAAAYDQAGFGHFSQSSSCWLYTILVSDREKFVQHMTERGIQCGRVHSSNKVHRIFRQKGDQPTPGADEFDAKQVSIPVGWWLSADDVQHIIKSVQEIL